MGFNIYFSDLKEDAQNKLMESVGIKDPKERNWSTDWNKDMFPLFHLELEEEEDDGLGDIDWPLPGGNDVEPI